MVPWFPQVYCNVNTTIIFVKISPFLRNCCRAQTVQQNFNSVPGKRQYSMHKFSQNLFYNIFIVDLTMDPWILYVSLLGLQNNYRILAQNTLVSLVLHIFI